MSGGWVTDQEKPTRKERLPDNWEELRSIVKARAGGRCEMLMASGKRCRDKGTDCDHKVRGDDHSLSNLQWICSWHHRRKTAIEANQARVRGSNKHPGEKHPSGLKLY